MVFAVHPTRIMPNATRRQILRVREESVDVERPCSRETRALYRRLVLVLFGIEGGQARHLSTVRVEPSVAFS